MYLCSVFYIKLGMNTNYLSVAKYLLTIMNILQKGMFLIHTRN